MAASVDHSSKEFWASLLRKYTKLSAALNDSISEKLHQGGYEPEQFKGHLAEGKAWIVALEIQPGRAQVVIDALQKSFQEPEPMQIGAVLLLSAVSYSYATSASRVQQTCVLTRLKRAIHGQSASPRAARRRCPSRGWFERLLQPAAFFVAGSLAAECVPAGCAAQASGHVVLDEKRRKETRPVPRPSQGACDGHRQSSSLERRAREAGEECTRTSKH